MNFTPACFLLNLCQAPPFPTMFASTPSLSTQRNLTDINTKSTNNPQIWVRILKIHLKQESIPVWCVPAALAANTRCQYLPPRYTYPPLGIPTLPDTYPHGKDLVLQIPPEGSWARYLLALPPPKDRMSDALLLPAVITYCLVYFKICNMFLSNRLIPLLLEIVENI